MRRFFAAGSLLLSSHVLAHTGHGSRDNGLMHYLSEPLHLFGIIAVASGVAGILFVLQRLRRQHR